MSSHANNEYNMMVAGVVCLLVVILLVLLLHIFATRCLFSRIPSPSPHRNTTADAISYQHNRSKGLHTTAITATTTMIPVFVYQGRHLECAICLNGFEEGEKGRRLPRCGHAFHVDCIDTWLSVSSSHNHVTCPICRLPVFPYPISSNPSNTKHNNHEISIVIAGPAPAAAVVNGSGTTHEHQQLNGTPPL